METIEAICTRRSIHRFLDKKVEPEKLATLLQAAMHAPSAMNEQPWRFLVLDDRALFPAIIEVHPYSSMLKTAPLAILVCGDLSLEKVPGNWVLDCSCAAQNILLAARAIGLGSVWTGVYPEEDRMTALAKMFSLPGELRPFALLGIGYPQGADPEQPERFKPERISLNSWGTPYG
jgi:nitroreductase